MPDWLNNMDPHWAWLTIGVLLCAAEIVAPGFFLVWLGVAAIATGVLAFLLPIGVPMQLGVFAVLAFIALYSARRWLRDNPIVSTDPLLNNHRIPGQVEVDEHVGGLKVDALRASLC